MPLSKFLNNKQEQAPVNAAGASSAYNPFAKLLEDNFMLNKKIQSRTLDFLSSETGLTSRPLNLDASKYADYDVFINDIDTREELDKERAKNQSALEQTGRMLGQMVASEVILGSLRGFSDIVDAAVNLPETLRGENDFTNPVSGYLEDLQNDVREKLEIYRENPNDTWDVTDYGWWTNNAVSIASTLSLMIPGSVYTKGLSLLGKSLNASKYLRKGLSIVSKHPNVRTKQLEGLLELGANAGLMRTAEGYIESRDTYNTVYDEIRGRVSEMSNVEREELNKYNPRFRGMTPEQVAETAAGESAVDTFKDDYWLMLLDAWQLKSLRNIGRGFKNISTTNTLRQANRASIDRLVGRTPVKQSAVKQYFSNLDGSGLKTIAAELSEGFEEGYQYIQQQEGIDKGRKMIDPNYQARGYADYLTDGHMWEQAFWGWMGGVAFQGIGSAANAVASKYISKNEDVLANARKSEIEGRITTLQNFISNVEMLRQNKNPFNIVNGENPDITDEERDALVEYAFEKLATDLTINAAKKGNYDLLKEFLASGEFQQYIDQSNVAQTSEQRQYLSDIIQHMDEVYETFEGEVNKVISNDVVNKGIVDRIATDNTYLKLAARSNDVAIERYDQTISEVKNRINDEKVNGILSLGEKSYKLGMLNATIQHIKQQLAENDAKLKAKKINRAEHNRIKNDLNNYLFALYQEAAPGIETEAQFNDYFRNPENYDESAINMLEHIDRAAHEAIANKVSNEVQKVYYNYQIANTKDEIQTKAKQIETEFAFITDKMFQDTLAKLDDIYENNDVDEVLDYIYNKNPGNLTQEVRDAIDKAVRDIKVLDPSDENYAKQIVARAEAKAKQKGARPVATVNGNPMDAAPAAAAEAAPPPDESDKADKAEQTDKNEAKLDDSPTGGQKQGVDKTQFAGYEEDSDIDEKILKEQEKLAETDKFDIGNIAKDSIETIRSLKQGEEYKNADNDQRVEQVKAKLIEQGYNRKDLDNENNLISSMVKTDRRTDTMLKRSVENYDDIVYRILANIEVNDEFFDEAIRQFGLENKTITINGVTHFNIISFLKYVAKSDIITRFEDLREVRNQLLNYMRETKKYKFDAIPAVTDATLQAILAKADLSSLEDDGRINILPEKDRVNEDNFQTAYHDIKPGDELFVIANNAGIEFYKTISIGNHLIDVKVAFNKFAKANSKNNGYYTSIGKINYEVFNKDGNYGSTLDWFLDEIFKEDGVLSQEAQDIISWILEPASITNETFNKFKNNTLIQRLVKDHISNKTITLENAREIISSLINLYNYDKNGDYFDKRMSFANWFEKQYNNFKMTDSLREKSGKTVTVKYISYGEAIMTEEENQIDKVIVNFNHEDHHLGFVTGKSIIKDLSNGDDIAAPGFNHQGLVVIVPNGTNGKHYARVKPQKIDTSKGFGKAIRDELFDIISRHMTGEDTYRQTVDKINSLFGYKNLVDGVLAYDYNGRLLIKDPNSNLPIITIYSKQSDNVTDSTGITVNLGTAMADSVGAIVLDDETKALINKGLDKILSDATYSLSFDFAGSDPISNNYVKKDDKKLTITIGGQTFNYENYLDFLIKNDAGRINLGKRTFNNGVSTNFETGSSLTSRGNIRIEPNLTPRREGNNPAEAARAKKVDDYIEAGNVKSKSTNVLIKDIMPDYTELEVLKQEGFISDKVEIDMTTEAKDANGNLVRGAYSKSARAKKGKITLYKAFFEDAKTSQHNAMRILIHENIHRGIAEIDNLFAQEEFIDELRVIRDTFLDALTDGTERNAQARAYLETIKDVDVTATIAKLRTIFENNNTELYNLEEFLTESMTSSIIQGLLNNIDSTRAVSVERDATKQSLWQRILEAIRKLFKFVDIKDNTLLAQEFELLGKKFDTSDKAAAVAVEETSQEESPTINNTDIAAKAVDDTFDDVDLDAEDDDLFGGLSSVNYDEVININSVTRRLTISERAKFEASLDTGRIKMYCV